MKVREALTSAAARLAGVGETARLDAELLMACALAITRDELLLTGLDRCSPECFEALVQRRLAHEPVAYITGRRAFWTVELEVSPGVLVPRADSETLMEAAVAHFAGSSGPRTILDLGTGSGALLLAALDQWPEARGIGVDVSEAAVRIARANVRRLGLRPRARIVHGGWPGPDGPYDLILCNPPYVSTKAELPSEVVDWEPASALFAGPDGMEQYLMIAPVLRPQLGPCGVACIEIGAGQAGAAGALFEAEGFRVAVRRDLAGHDRCLIVTS